MKIGVVGARDHRALAQVLRRVRELPEDAVVVSGGADGVDTVAALAARQRGFAVEEHLPGADGPLARNATIAEAVDELDAFPWEGCRGTWDTVRKVQARGVPVRIHEPERPALLVFSARRDYAGPGALCVMRRGGPPEGLPFAPTEALLDRVLAERRRAKDLREKASALCSAQISLGDTKEEILSRNLRAMSMREQADEIERASWLWYEKHYLAEARVVCGLRPSTAAWARQTPEEQDLFHEAWKRGARPNRSAYQRILSRGVVVLLCYCSDANRCHRAILRRRILPALGAVDGGEV